MKRMIQVMQEADADLKAIWFYGYWNFGMNKAEDYARKLYQRFYHLEENELGRKRLDLGQSIFSMPHREHVIYYLVESENVFIMRVLHHSQDALSQITVPIWF